MIGSDLEIVGSGIACGLDQGNASEEMGGTVEKCE
jgi:hypothetical protein